MGDPGGGPTAPSGTDVARRCAQVRRDIFEMVVRAGCGHLGGSLSSVEILVTLYFRILRIDPGKPRWELRDRFVNSKGHATAAYYATLANRGYFSRESVLGSFLSIDAAFEEHGSMNVPGVDISTGSLGQGLSVGAGIALSAKWEQADYRAYVLLGDGECQEGQVWEAALFGAHFRLDNLVAVVDRNRLQVMGSTQDILNLEPLREKWRSFGWDCFVVDGHDLEALGECLEGLEPDGRPKVILADTVKGRGISFMENDASWHSYRPLSAKELATARAELAG
jgi:transketolase